MTTFAEVIGFVSTTEELSDETIQVLSANEQLSARLADEIAALKPFSFAMELASVLPTLPKPQVAKIAAHIVTSFKELGFGNAVEATPVAPAAAMPTSFKLEVPKSLDEMSTSELLAMLAEEPQRFAEIEAVLRNKSDYRDAVRKAGDRIGFVRDGKLSVENVLAYIRHLTSDPAAQAQPKFNGLRPVSLRVALGVEVRRLKDPFTAQAYVGLLEGYDLSTVGEIYEALIWFVETQTGGNTLRSLNALQRRAYFEALVSDQLPTELRAILDDYAAAKVANDPTTRNVTRYAQEGSSSKKSDSQAGFLLSDEMLEVVLGQMAESYAEVGEAIRSLPREDCRLIVSQMMNLVMTQGSQVDEAAMEAVLSNLPQDVQERFAKAIEQVEAKSNKGEAYYKRLLEDAAGDVWSPRSYGQSPRHKVVKGMTVGHYGCRINGVVSLGSVILNSYNTRGTVYILRGTRFEDNSYDNAAFNVEECRTYQELAKYAGLV